jgi:hypothetical protein
LNAYWAVEEQLPCAVHVTLAPTLAVLEGTFDVTVTEVQSASWVSPRASVPSASGSSIAPGSPVLEHPLAPTNSIKNKTNREPNAGILPITATTSK